MLPIFIICLRCQLFKLGSENQVKKPAGQVEGGRYEILSIRQRTTSWDSVIPYLFHHQPWSAWTFPISRRVISIGRQSLLCNTVQAEKRAVETK